MIVAPVFIEFCDRLHLVIGQGEVEDIEIILDVIDVLAAGDHDKAHLRMPAQNDLSGCFAVLFAELSKDGLFQQALVAVTEGIPAHQLNAVLIKRFAQFLLRKIRMRFHLDELRRDLPLML